MSSLPQKILIATRNQGKVRELRDLVKDFPIEFLSMTEFPDAADVEEDGETFEENAMKKARTLALATGLVTLADDSGLCIDALNGRPGVLSARYAARPRPMRKNASAFSKKCWKCLIQSEQQDSCAYLHSLTRTVRKEYSEEPVKAG